MMYSPHCVLCTGSGSRQAPMRSQGCTAPLLDGKEAFGAKALPCSQVENKNHESGVSRIEK